MSSSEAARNFHRVAFSIGISGVESGGSRKAQGTVDRGEFAVPSPCDSYEDFRRYTHCDLTDLSDLDLWIEERRSGLALVLGDRRHREWHLQRVEACRRERERGECR